MNKLVWLWDVLVVERRTTRLPEAINDAYERGYRDALDDMLTAAEQRSHHEMMDYAHRRRA